MAKFKKFLSLMALGMNQAHQTEALGGIYIPMQ
jgi:hypothetical protein